MELPDFEKSFEYENNFYLSCGVSRISKIISQYELYKIAHALPGALVECGVFKGASLARFAMMRSLMGGPFGKKIIGFDIFGDFLKSQRDDDELFRNRFIDHTGTPTSIMPDQLMQVLEHKGVHQNIELIAGDINVTIPEYARTHEELKISLLNMDTGTYDSSLTILENFYHRVVPGGVILIDNYTGVAAETKAVDEFFADKDVTIEKHAYALTPCFVIKKK